MILIAKTNNFLFPKHAVLNINMCIFAESSF